MSARVILCKGREYCLERFLVFGGKHLFILNALENLGAVKLYMLDKVLLIRLYPAKRDRSEEVVDDSVDYDYLLLNLKR